MGMGMGQLKIVFTIELPNVVSTVTLNANDGTINAGNVTEYTEGTGATLPTDVTKAGYVFGGWYDNENLTGSAVTAIGTDATGNKTYWAKWLSYYVVGSMTEWAIDAE